ncbi:hypothetical protein V6C21_04900 [[Clostridium] cellulosi]|jgi:hypothetical protein
MKFNILKNIPDLYKKKDRNLYIAESKRAQKDFMPEMRSMRPISRNSTVLSTGLETRNK